MYSTKYLSAVLLLIGPGLFLNVASGQVKLVETLRFYKDRSKPKLLVSMADSPNSKLLALSFKNGDLAFVDLVRKRVTKAYDISSFSPLVFSSDSDRLLGIAYDGMNLVNLRYGGISKLSIGYQVGIIGLRHQIRNGKIIVDEIVAGSPLSETEVQPGDELIAFKNGKTKSSTQEWVSTIGMSSARFSESFRGPAGSWVTIRCRSHVDQQIRDYVVRRSGEDVSKTRLARESSRSLLLDAKRRNVTFRSGADGTPITSTQIHGDSGRGIPIVSPDGKTFAYVARDENTHLWMLEVHDLLKRDILKRTEIPEQAFKDVAFSDDGKVVLVGTRDSIERFDVTEKAWIKPISITPKMKRDPGRVVSRNVALGFGGPGDLYTIVREKVYETKAALDRIAVSSKGLIAIASEDGVLSFLPASESEFKPNARIKVLTKAPRELGFTQDGNIFFMYSEGTLYLFQVE